MSKAVHVMAVMVTVLAIIIGLLSIGIHVVGMSPYVVLSGSMEPEIATGSVVFIRDVQHKSDDYAPGQIIAYKAQSGIAVVHRIISVTDDGLFEMKGDANRMPDAHLVYPSQVIGQYYCHIEGAGYLISRFEGRIFEIGDMRFSGTVLFAIAALVLLNVFDFVLADVLEDRQNEEDVVEDEE